MQKVIKQGEVGGLDESISLVLLRMSRVFLLVGLAKSLIQSGLVVNSKWSTSILANDVGPDGLARLIKPNM